ncbi:MAG: glutathione S-transferase family protein [Alphaproteobacteria bacterium]|nr:glutathione S-transferase family protein [Alphaproteobacteria bacterium]
MADITIHIGNRNYSSWSLRAWLMLKQTGAAFESAVIPLYAPGSKAEILRHSPSGKVPALQHGDVAVWDSLAIGEYLNEAFPKAGLWPATAVARACARSISAEMHSGFVNLRRHLPMNMRRAVAPRPLTDEVRADIGRIAAIWRDCRNRFGAGGAFLFGVFGIADAMYAPVVSRLRSYAVPIDPDTAAYCDAIEAHPPYREWSTAAKDEPMVVAEFEV